TAYGVQGATVNSSHTMLSESTSAAGVYVGMTRGRHTNRLHLFADDMADARAQFIEAMERDPADRGLDHATRVAQEAVRGLIADGPVRLVTEELAHLDHETERAEQAAERWEQTATRFDAQRATHHAEDEDSAAVLRRAEDTAAQIRTEVAQPLTVQAQTDGAAYVDAVADEAAAKSRLATAGRFSRRKARTEHHITIERSQALRAQVRETWGEPPRTTEALPEWASGVAARRAEADPRVIEVAQPLEAAQADRVAMQERHKQEQLALLVSEYGPEQARRNYLGMRVANPHGQAREAKAQAVVLRAEVEELRSLPIHDAAQRIEAMQTEQQNHQQ